MKIAYEFIKRDIAGESFLVPVGEGAKKFKGLFALNELGAFLWDRLAGAADEKELKQAVLAEYDVDSETAEKDIRDFLKKLADMGMTGSKDIL